MVGRGVEGTARGVGAAEEGSMVMAIALVFCCRCSSWTVGGG